MVKPSNLQRDAGETALGVEADQLREQQAGVPHRVLSALHTVSRPGLQRLSSGDPTFPQPCDWTDARGRTCGAVENVGLSPRSQSWRCGAHVLDD